MAISREIDQRLIERGMQVIDGKPGTNGEIWRLVKARWFNKDESGGRHHIYVESIDEDGKDIGGLPFEVIWPTGSKVYSTNGRRGFYAANHPMSPSRNEFAVLVKDGDSVRGLGMGEMTPGGYNAGIHTATLLIFQLQRANVTLPPTPIPDGQYIQIVLRTMADGLQAKEEILWQSK